MAKATSKGGFAALSAAAGKKTSAQAKSSVPTTDAPTSIRPAIAEWIEAKRMEKTAEANRKAAEAAMADTASKLRIDLCRRDQEVYSSVRLNGGPSGSITAVQAAKYKKMPTQEHQDALLALFGDEDFERFFAIKTAYSLDADKLMAHPKGAVIAQKIAEALAPLGEDAQDIFKEESVIVPTEYYDSESVLNPNVAEKAAKATAEGRAVIQSIYFKL